jgi:hypothetical protein
MNEYNKTLGAIRSIEKIHGISLLGSAVFSASAPSRHISPDQVEKPAKNQRNELWAEISIIADMISNWRDGVPEKKARIIDRRIAELHRYNMAVYE